MFSALILCSALAACQMYGESQLPGPDGTILSQDFESDTLRGWDGFDPSRHRIVHDEGGAQSGKAYLAVKYTRGRDGGWLTHFLMPGYDALYVSYYLRLPQNWQGGTKLMALYGSRTDDQWSAMGKAGTCPNGTDFFAAMLTTEFGDDLGPTHFYTYYPAMAREPDGRTCWGRFGNATGSEHSSPARYVESLMLSRGQWHHIEFEVELNKPGESDGRQTFWIDGSEWGSWSGISFRKTDILRLNAVQLTFSSQSIRQPEELFVDNLVVRDRRR